MEIQATIVPNKAFFLKQTISSHLKLRDESKQKGGFFMRKPLVAVLATSLLLGACGTDRTIPPANETPMEDVREGAQEMVPDVTPPETNGDRDPNNDLLPDERNDVSPTDRDKNTDTDKDMMRDPNTNEEDIMEDDIDMKDRDNQDE